MTDSAGQDVGRKAVRGIRWVLLINVITLPMSFVLNAILGRISPEAIGQYGAIQVYLGTFHTFVVLGGAYVFTRLVPAIPSRRRVWFLLSYGSVVLGLLLTLAAVVPLVAPGTTELLLERFGGPALALLLGLSVAVVLWSFASHFLYAVLRAPSAVVLLRSVVLGNCVLVVLGALAFRETLRIDPGRYLWPGTLLIYILAAILGALFVARAPESRDVGRPRWFLPDGFWGVVSYTHLQKLVTYLYGRLAPLVVLLWLDQTALGHLHAAMRYPTLLTFVPAMITSVLAPGISTLEVSGRRDEGLRQSRAAINGALVFLVPATLGIVLFAEDAMAVFGPDFRQDAALLAIIGVTAISRPVIDIGSGVIVALGEFRAYLAASVIFLVVAIGLTATLVPVYGLPGAALAMTLGAFAQHTSIHLFLRRLGFGVPARVYVSWAVVGVGAVSTALLRPDRPTGVAIFVLLTAVFAIAGRVTPREVERLVRRAVGRD